MSSSLAVDCLMILFHSLWRWELQLGRAGEGDIYVCFELGLTLLPFSLEPYLSQSA